MNSDIRIAVSFKTHRKRKRLRLALGAGATDYLLDLWIAAAMNHPSGRLTGMDELDIALDAGWEDEPGKFVAALLDCGFLDRLADGTYALHDWQDHQGYVVHAEERQQRARLAAAKRWGKKDGAEASLQGNADDRPQENADASSRRAVGTPQGDVNSLPQGHVNSAPQGDMNNPLQGNAGRLPNGNSDSSPQGNAGRLPRGDANIPPQGNVDHMRTACPEHADGNAPAPAPIPAPIPDPIPDPAPLAEEQSSLRSDCLPPPLTAGSAAAGAALVETDLAGAGLVGTDFVETDLAGTGLAGTDFIETDLAGAKAKSACPTSSADPTSSPHSPCPAHSGCPPSSPRAACPPCPHGRLVEIYHQQLPTFPMVKTMNSTREGYARGRWRETWDRLRKDGRPHDTAALLDYFSRYFAYVGQSDFLSGRSTPRNGTVFQADFEWLLRPGNFAKVIEEFYHRRAA